MRRKSLGTALVIGLLLQACQAEQTVPPSEAPANDPAAAGVIEIATFNLKPGTSLQEFEALDAAVEREHVSQQAGFVSRETGFTKDGGWLVVVHWASTGDADASMISFASAPAATGFMNALDETSMTMTRYSINQ